jgi:hypothetical protein
MGATLVALVGHQPLPTLLTFRHFKPSRVILLGSGTKSTNQRKNNLIELFKRDAKKKGAHPSN